MRIKINGKEQVIEKGLSVAELLIVNKVEMPDMVSVQLNGEFVRRGKFSQTVLKENDEIDFLYFMGGGK
ncbi:MAG: sulfur carrier protein ThiS [Elusimicrobia bacterium]|nr:sulfur carrier protein ThiS [Elusimicrobiota bacterium]